jgi:hypothetical protein
MSWLKTLLLPFDRTRENEAEIDEELRFHLELRMRDNRAAGMSEEAARADALRRFGDYEQVKQECRAERSAGKMSTKAYQGIIWVMFGLGLALFLTNDIWSVRQVGKISMTIALLWRLLLYLRAVSPSQKRINAALAEQSMLNLSAPVAPLAESIAPHDQQGRTPVERLLNDEKQA